MVKDKLPRIYQLTTLVANQIAAGEVIERPASVVKELLENALDADASSINIEIGFGGLNQITLSDNGQGIVDDDLPLAIAPHATSKIQNVHDLFQIKSMGFRGEALASIAAVSRLCIQSRPAHQPVAKMLTVNDQGIQLVPCARNPGTTVDVRDLFFNTPVRKKFLKSEFTEYQMVEAVIKRFSLSAPHVALTLKHNDKLMLTLPAVINDNTQQQRLRKILGKTFIDHAIYLDVERAGMRLRGWISDPEYQRSQSDRQWVYLNGRMIKDKLIYHALKQAYEHVLYPGRYPVCALYLTIPLDEVDVNVHPTKHEVRFVQARLVHDFIVSQLMQALQMFNAAVPMTPTNLATTVNESQAPYAHKNIISRERYDDIALLKSSLVSTQNTPSPSWVILNSHFAIIFISSKQPYLIDVERVYQLKLKEVLQQQILPLAARPLLVPIRYHLKKEDAQKFEQYLLILLQWGLQFDFLSDSEIIVRTLPHLLPCLDIHHLLSALFNDRWDAEDISSHLVKSHIFDIYQLSTSEKMELVDFIQQRWGAISLPNELGTCLDQSRCRELLHG